MTILSAGQAAQFLMGSQPTKPNFRLKIYGRLPSTKKGGPFSICGSASLVERAWRGLRPETFALFRAFSFYRRP